MNRLAPGANPLLEDLVARHEVDRRSETIRRLIRGGGDLHDLLRHHSKRPIEEWEIPYRDDLDYLLAACGLFEIFCHLDGIRGALPYLSSFDLMDILNNDYIRTYYQKTYPIILPQLLRSRMLRELPAAYRRAPAPASVSSEALFSTTYALDRRRLDDADLTLFLSLMDDYWIGEEFSIATVLKALQRPMLMAELLLEDSTLPPGGGRDLLASALDGFDAFLTYAGDLRGLLLRHEGTVYASLLWLYHSYFFAGTGTRVRAVLSELRQIVGEWASAWGNELAGEQEAEIGGLLDDLANQERWIAPVRSAGVNRELATLVSPILDHGNSAAGS